MGSLQMKIRLLESLKCCSRLLSQYCELNSILKISAQILLKTIPLKVAFEIQVFVYVTL